MLPLSMMHNNVSQEPIDASEDGEIAEEVNVAAVSGDTDANAVTDTVATINNDEKKDVEMTDVGADVSSATPPNNINHDTDNNDINTTTQFAQQEKEFPPTKPEPEEQQMQTKEEEPESPPVQMDTTEDTSAEDHDPVVTNTATAEEETTIIAAAPSPPSPEQQNGDMAVHPYKPDSPTKEEFIAPEDPSKEESIAPAEVDPVAVPTKPSTPLTESNMVTEEETPPESDNMVVADTANTTENTTTTTTTTTEVSAPPTTTAAVEGSEDGEITGTEADKGRNISSASSQAEETIPKFDADATSTSAASLTTKAPLVDSGDVTEEQKPINTSPSPTPQSQPQLPQGSGFQLGEEGSASNQSGKEVEDKVDDVAVDATTNDPVVASLDDGKEPSLATKIAEDVPVQEFTSKPSSENGGKPSDENDDVEMTVEKQDQHVDMNNHNMNNHNMNSLLSKINNSSTESASTAAASNAASQDSQQQHQQRPPSFNNFQQQQQPISRSNSNDGVGPSGVMAVMNNNGGNPLGLSTGGMPMPGMNNDGKSNFFNNMANNDMNNNSGQHAGSHQPVRPPPPMGPMGGMRELRVEDALLYLDDVKREFGGKPRVYNEFLAIMKNFKSQEVDTPGVIARVSKLFRGNNHLILGFNKFLPDGYKISMEDLRQMDQAYAREEEIVRQQQAAMAAKGQHQQHEHQQRQQFEAQMQLPQQRLLAERQMQQQLQQQQQQLPPSHMAGPLSQQLQQQHQPPIQDVQMKQAQANRQRMQVATDLQEQQRQQQAIPKPPKQPKQGGKAGKSRKVHDVIPPQQQQQPQQPPPQQQPQQIQQQNQPHQAVEFDHAISYVTTIKRRFANDQSTYHSFLEILHTYQKEQRGIKEVLEQVAHLFQDHPDLLKEFTFFLPDAVQEQAKERLHRAAAESESRLSAQKDKKNKQLQGSSKEIVDMTEHPIPVDQTEARGQKRYHKDVQEAPVVITYPQTPETFVYNSAVERQFFDAAKEALASYTRDGGQAWAEFMKCLDMYAQEILSRSEMLNFVEPLLGKRNNKLFEEFKRILAAAGGQGTNTVPSMEDSWYSVPLSEIDFSRCRRCSPSYRALPRDYPAPPCSKRSDEERMVLNDVWVSLPVGSEESYTFRHMRRNTYEETLFRVEDERFEIDMTIDSNLCTLALLEPFAQEMAQLSGNDGQMQIDKENESKTNMEQKGLGGKRFRYTFDPTILGVIHRNSITRIYGDNGAEMLELLKTNPSVAIPIVVDRLRQKDVEWQKVRDRLNRHWKEMAENNYYKSLDHRSLTWRTTDKRAISNRTLLTDIKDRAANDGNESEAALQVRIDKAKEEHGLFFEVTMGNAFLQKIDLSVLPKPDRRLFTPDMSLMYEDTAWVQKDAYRILSFALERGSISPTDKERCHRLWTEFLGPWFDLNLNWMLTPAVNFQETKTSSSKIPRVVSKDDNSPEEDEEEEDSLDEEGEINSRIVTETVRDDEHDCDDDCDSPTHMDHHPLPAGSTVTTIYGEGRIMSCRTDIYVVKLAFGTAYLRPSAVLCSVLAAEKSAYTTQRMDDDNTKLDRPNDKLMIGTQSLYLFFRLHQILCRRIGIARKLAFEVKNDPSLQTLVEQMPGQYGSGAAAGKRRYDAFLSLVYALLDGGTGGAAEGGKFEDRVRSLLGHGGYELATMDKLISHILKNIQSMANDDTMWSLVQLFRRHLDAGGFKPEAFRQEAAYLSDGEHMYAFQLCPIHKDRGDKSVLYVENLGVIVGSEEEDSLPSDPPVEETKTKEPISKRQKR